MAFADAQANGVLDYGEGEAELKLATAAKVGDCIGWSSGWKRALGTAAGNIHMRCVAGEDGSTGQRIKIKGQEDRGTGSGDTNITTQITPTQCEILQAEV